MKMQNVSFRSIEEFFDFLSADELKVVKALREIVFSCAPAATEKLAYNVPFYKQHKNFCFIWPASVLWGKKKTYEGVRFGFTNGHLLPDEINYLSKEKRKFVYWRDFKTLRDIDTDLLKSYIFEALIIDEQLSGTGKKQSTV
jgi:hypothetical protein